MKVENKNASTKGCQLMLIGLPKRLIRIAIIIPTLTPNIPPEKVKITDSVRN